MAVRNLVAYLAVLTLPGCGIDLEKPKARHTNNQAEANPEPPQEKVEPAPVSENLIHPKLLFHGGGGMSTSAMIDMTSAAAVLKKLGVPGEHIHLIKYPHTKNIKDINAAVDTQLKTIFAKYPANTRFDSIGHSLGLLASFISLSELGHLPKIRSIIGVTGVLMRQDVKALPMGCTKGSTTDLCGDIFDKVLGTSNSPYILELLSKNATELKRINKCSIWTSQDGVLSPPNAGVFPDGKSVEMPKSWCTATSGIFGNLNPCHLKAKSATPVYEAMKTQCFGGDFK